MPKPPIAQAVLRARHDIRIIGGQWKRSKLPVADRPGLRPTPDRVRETLFNWLGQDLAGWCCFDAFAGTGALGFEAASRGAALVCMVEQDPLLIAQLKSIEAKLHATSLRIQRGDGVTLLQQQSPASLDLVFLDPPFDSLRYESALQASVRALKPSGYIYLEAPTAWTDERLLHSSCQVYRHVKAGAVHAHLLRRTDAEPEVAKNEVQTKKKPGSLRFRAFDPEQDSGAAGRN